MLRCLYFELLHNQSMMSYILMMKDNGKIDEDEGLMVDSICLSSFGIKKYEVGGRKPIEDKNKKKVKRRASKSFSSLQYRVHRNRDRPCHHSRTPPFFTPLPSLMISTNPIRATTITVYSHTTNTSAGLMRTVAIYSQRNRASNV